MDSNEYRELQEWDALRAIERNTRYRNRETGPQPRASRSRPLGPIGKAIVVLTLVIASGIVWDMITAVIHFYATQR